MNPNSNPYHQNAGVYGADSYPPAANPYQAAAPAAYAQGYSAPGAYPVYNAAHPDAAGVAKDMDAEKPHTSVAVGHTHVPSSYSAWMDKKVRLGFIRKVCLILAAQLLFTFGIIFLFVFNDNVKQWVFDHKAFFYVALAVQFGIIIALSCCGNVRRKYPTNLILLAAFTAAEAYLMGAISATYDTNSVLIAFGVTTAVCASLAIFSVQTKYDFTTCGAGLFAALMVFTVMGILMLIFRGSQSMVLQVLYGSIGALLFSVYLVYDIQMMAGGRKNSLSPDEYITAALSIYLDVVNIFMYILQILGKRN